MRSFFERPGFRDSSFASRPPPKPPRSRDSSIRGVLPMVSTDDGITGMNYLYNTAAFPRAPAAVGACYLCNLNPLPCIFLSVVFTDDKLTRRRLLSAFSLFPAVRLLSGQQSPPAEHTPQYSADVRLVNLFATVRDKAGKIVKDLTKDNFQLDEEDHPQDRKSTR